MNKRLNIKFLLKNRLKKYFKIIIYIHFKMRAEPSILKFNGTKGV